MTNKIRGLPNRETNPEYIAWVKTQSCIICGEKCFWGVQDPHHPKTVATGGSDDLAYPLCRCHHNEAGTLGRERFENRYAFQVRKWYKYCDFKYKNRNAWWNN